MTEISQLMSKSDRTFVLVCLNFVMLFVLFCGLGYVVWQSATLLDDLRSSLDKAESAVAELRGRIQEMDMDTVMERVSDGAAEKLKGSVASVIEQSDWVNTVRNLSGRIDDTQAVLARTSESIQAINDKLQKMDAEQLGQAVSYHMLQGLGEGFSQAAEARKPAAGN